MTSFFEAAWKTISKEVEFAQKTDKNIYLNETLKNEICNDLHIEYEKIKNTYMSKDTEFLDRHKVIAILVTLMVKKDLIKYKGKLKADEIFLGKELIATSVAFSVMFDLLQDRLNKAGYKLECNAYYMPIAMACSTPYQIIFARNLRYCQENGGINILELSEKLFLIETITLVKNNIDPTIIAEYKV